MQTVFDDIREDVRGEMEIAREGVRISRERQTPANDNHFTDLRAANIARQKEWDSDSKISGPLGKLWRANELSGECGEASNVVKKLVREDLGIRGSRATVQQLAEELADIIICADLLAEEYGIDLQAATRAKFNATSEKVGLRTRLVAA